MTSQSKIFAIMQFRLNLCTSYRTPRGQKQLIVKHLCSAQELIVTSALQEV